VPSDEDLRIARKQLGEECSKGTQSSVTNPPCSEDYETSSSAEKEASRPRRKAAVQALAKQEPIVVSNDSGSDNDYADPIGGVVYYKKKKNDRFDKGAVRKQRGSVFGIKLGGVQMRENATRLIRDDGVPGVVVSYKQPLFKVRWSTPTGVDHEDYTLEDVRSFDKPVDESGSGLSTLKADNMTAFYVSLQRMRLHRLYLPVFMMSLNSSARQALDMSTYIAVKKIKGYPVRTTPACLELTTAGLTLNCADMGWFKPRTPLGAGHWLYKGIAVRITLPAEDMPLYYLNTRYLMSHPKDPTKEAIPKSDDETLRIPFILDRCGRSCGGGGRDADVLWKNGEFKQSRKDLDPTNALYLTFPRSQGGGGGISDIAAGCTLTRETRSLNEIS